MDIMLIAVTGVLINLAWFLVIVVGIVTFRSDKSLMLKIPLWVRWLMGAVIFVPWIYMAMFLVCLAVIFAWFVVDTIVFTFLLTGE